MEHETIDTEAERETDSPPERSAEQAATDAEIAAVSAEVSANDAERSVEQIDDRIGIAMERLADSFEKRLSHSAPDPAKDDTDAETETDDAERDATPANLKKRRTLRERWDG